VSARLLLGFVEIGARLPNLGPPSSISLSFAWLAVTGA
jgi:hypothetical protein